LGFGGLANAVPLVIMMSYRAARALFGRVERCRT
jgi:hypothetical protein